MESVTTRSLNIPTINPLPCYKEYVEHPLVEILNQIMIHYLGIEEILKLYSVKHRQFETTQSLNILSQRFDLPEAGTFKELLKSYDMKYATVRSYHHIIKYRTRTAKDIISQAAREGNIQAVYNGLILHPNLRKKKLYNDTLEHAAIGNHRVIIDLLLDLGADPNDRYGHINVGASIGGHLELMKDYCALNSKSKCPGHGKALSTAAKYGHLDILDYLLAERKYNLISIRMAMHGAGEGDKQEIIDYLITKNNNSYLELLTGASVGGHLHIIEKYYDLAKAEVNQGNRGANEWFMNSVIYNHLDVVKFYVEKEVLTDDDLVEGLRAAIDDEHQEIVDYLISKGVVVQDSDDSDFDYSLL